MLLPFRVRNHYYGFLLRLFSVPDGIVPLQLFHFFLSHFTSFLFARRRIFISGSLDFGNRPFSRSRPRPDMRWTDHGRFPPVFPLQVSSRGRSRQLRGKLASNPTPRARTLTHLRQLWDARRGGTTEGRAKFSVLTGNGTAEEVLPKTISRHRCNGTCRKGPRVLTDGDA